MSGRLLRTGFLRRFAVSAALLAAAAPAARGAAPAPAAASVPRLVLQLRGEDPKAADAALDRLLAAGDDARQRAARALDDLVRRRRRLRDDAHRRAAALVRALDDDKRLKALLDDLDRLAEAGKEAVAFAFDNARYPFPPKARTGWMPGRDYQKGQVLLEGRVEVAVAYFNRLEAKLVAAFGLAVTPKRPGGGGFGRDYLRGRLKDSTRPLRVLTYNFTDAGPAWARIGAAIVARHRAYERARESYEHALAMARKAGVAAAALADKDPPGKLPPLVAAAAALFAGRYEQALALRPTEGAPARLFDVLVRRHVLIRNAKAPGDWSREEKEMMHVLNLYRLSLGLDPLVANAKIYAAAREHSRWQDEHKEMTHTRPDAGRRSHHERCKAQGYPYAQGENISSRSGVAAIWAWRCDAAHHRNLISPRARAAAVAQSGRYATYNCGSVIEDPHLAALLKPAAGK